MFCTVNDCEIHQDESVDSQPKLILPGLRFGRVEVFKAGGELTGRS